MKKHIGLQIALGAVLLASCQPKANDEVPVAPQGEALFSHFSYLGDDDFYKQNPLPNETSYYNPILPGFYPDPTIVTNGKGDYYLATSTFTYLPGVPLFHSTDLVNWKQLGHILERESQVANCEGHDVSRGIFAPALAYNPATETYYMITTNVNAGTGNFYVKTQDPAGPWSDPIYLPSIQGIDPSIFIDDDGRAYVVNNDDAPDYKPEYPGHRTVRVQELDLATDQCVGERKIIINKGWNPAEKPVWCEAPHIYKINGYYYLMTAEGGTSTWHSEVMYRAKSVWGPYEPCKRNPFLTQRTLDPNRPNPVTCAGHADIVKTPEGNWYAVFLACRPVAGEDYENLGREVFMLPLTWDEEGWPVMTGQDKIIPQVVENGPAKRGEEVTFGNFSKVDEFDAPTLGMEWVTLRKKIENLYSFSEYPGWLSLKESPITAREKSAPAMILHRLCHHKFTAETTMRYQPVDESDAAGMVLYKDQDHYAFLALTQKEGKLEVQLQMVDAAKQPEYPGNDKTREELAQDVQIIAELPCDATEVDMQVTSDGYTFQFAFRPTGSVIWQTVGSIGAAKFSTRDTGGFCGTMVGLHCTGK